MEVMMEMFQKFVTPEQKRLAARVEKKTKLAALAKQKGGDAIVDHEQFMKELLDAIIDDEQDMKELLDDEASISAPAGMEKRKPAKEFNLAEIQHEIRDDPTEAIEKNREFFNRKLDIQRRQIQEDIRCAVRQGQERIIEAMNAGPHKRILDPVRIFVGSRNLV
jgi:hypothetical protein